MTSEHKLSIKLSIKLSTKLSIKQSIKVAEEQDHGKLQEKEIRNRNMPNHLQSKERTRLQEAIRMMMRTIGPTMQAHAND